MSESKQGTIKGVPKELNTEEKVQDKDSQPVQLESESEDPKNDSESPFEEPKLDVFGSGEGV